MSAIAKGTRSSLTAARLCSVIQASLRSLSYGVSAVLYAGLYSADDVIGRQEYLVSETQTKLGLGDGQVEDTPGAKPSSSSYLSDRCAYLTNQLASHYDDVTTTPHHQHHRRPGATRASRVSSAQTLGLESRQRNVASADQRRHLVANKPTSATGCGFIHDADGCVNCFYRLRSSHTQSVDIASSTTGSAWTQQTASDNGSTVPYSDPARYRQFGLFDMETALPSNAKPNLSALSTSSAAATNTSSVVSVVSVASQRPLSYETMRPVSAVLQTSSKRHVTSLPAGGSGPAKYAGVNRRRAKSAFVKRSTLSTRQGTRVEDGNRLTTTPENSDVEQERTSSCTEAAEEDKNRVDGLTRRRERGSGLCREEMDKTPGKLGEIDEGLAGEWKNRAGGVRGRRQQGPECVGGYEEDMDKTQAMEDRFRQQVVRLQQQLALTPSGYIVPRGHDLDL